jgi:hypothetical protein
MTSLQKPSSPKTKKTRKTPVKTPYTKLRDAAMQNAKTKRSSGAVQVRLSVMIIGVLLAVLVFFYPRFLSSFNKSTSEKG